MGALGRDDERFSEHPAVRAPRAELWNRLSPEGHSSDTPSVGVRELRMAEGEKTDRSHFWDFVLRIATLLASLLGTTISLSHEVSLWVKIGFAGLLLVAVGGFGIQAWTSWFQPWLRRRALLEECREFVKSLSHLVGEIERRDLKQHDDSFAGLFGHGGRLQTAGGEQVKIPPHCTGVLFHVDPLVKAVRKRMDDPIETVEDTRFLVKVCDRIINTLSQYYQWNWFEFLRAEWPRLHTESVSKVRACYSNLDALIREYNGLRTRTSSELAEAIERPVLEIELPKPLP